MFKSFYERNWKQMFNEFDTVQTCSFYDDPQAYSFYLDNESAIDAGNLIAKKTYFSIKNLFQEIFDEIWKEMCAKPLRYLNFWFFPTLIVNEIRRRIDPELWVVCEYEGKGKSLTDWDYDLSQKLRVSDLHRIELRDGKTLFVDYKEKKSNGVLKDQTFIAFDGETAILGNKRLRLLLLSE